MKFSSDVSFPCLAVPLTIGITGVVCVTILYLRTLSCNGRLQRESREGMPMHSSRLALCQNYQPKYTHVDPGRSRLSPSFSFIHIASLSSAIIIIFTL